MSVVAFSRGVFVAALWFQWQPTAAHQAAHLGHGVQHAEQAVRTLSVEPRGEPSMKSNGEKAMLTRDLRHKAQVAELAEQKSKLEAELANHKTKASEADVALEAAKASDAAKLAAETKLAESEKQKLALEAELVIHKDKAAQATSANEQGAASAAAKAAAEEKLAEVEKQKADLEADLAAHKSKAAEASATAASASEAAKASKAAKDAAEVKVTELEKHKAELEAAHKTKAAEANAAHETAKSSDAGKVAAEMKLAELEASFGTHLWQLLSKGPPAHPAFDMHPTVVKSITADKEVVVSARTTRTLAANARAVLVDGRSFGDILSSDPRLYDDGWDITTSTAMRILGTLLIVSFIVFAFNSIHELHRFWKLMHADPKEDGQESLDIEPQTEGDSQHWTVMALIGLTAYRFYTGFLTATWLPYLLAMEGQYLWPANQSMFMGCAKLIYGITILANPLLGLVGDRAVLISEAMGRRLFCRIGVLMAAIGICVCMFAGSINYFYTFMVGIFIWRFGEAINDVTTEALVPELVPGSQFKVASAVKAAMFLFGGMFGYILLIVAADVHYDWLYYAYWVGMIVSCVPVLYLLTDESPRKVAPGQQQRSFTEHMINAYITPIHVEGGFPKACLAVFIFSLGTAPMFFLLLIVRDIVGITNPVTLQENFSGSSIMFFVSAALAAVVSGTGPPPNPNAGQEPDPQTLITEARGTAQPSQATQDTPLVKSILSMTVSVIIFGSLCILLPFVGLLQSVETRTIIFYLIATAYGFAFGTAFSQFQGVTWQLLPPGTDTANLMGFNVMSRLLGLGVGNFIAGLVLDFFYVGTFDPSTDVATGYYKLSGYFIMCAGSGILAWGSSGIAYSLALQYRRMSQLKESLMIAVAG